MTRIARVVAPKHPHHITQRGNRRCQVFFDDLDRTKYVQLLSKYSTQYGLHIWAYCLMDNHVHFVCVPETMEALGKTFRDTHQAYAMYLNQALGETGHLWQGRFFSCVLDEEHLWAAVRYVEMNPVRAGVVERAEGYAWSSARAHVDRRRRDPLLAADFPPSGMISSWSEWLAFSSKEQEERLFKHTQTGRPLGSAPFVKRLEKALGRSLARRKPGPKPTQPRGRRSGG